MSKPKDYDYIPSKSDIDSAIRVGAVKDGQFATAFALLQVAEAINTLSSTAGHERNMMLKEMVGSVADAISGVGTCIETAGREVSDELGGYVPVKPD